MERTKVVLFDQQNIHTILKQFGYIFSEEEEGKAIIDDNNQLVKCAACKTELTVDKVGNIAPGSRLIFCDNPVCFSVWVAKNKLK